MNITEKTKEVIRLENVEQFDPKVIRILDNKGVCIAFAVVAHNSVSVHINVCQEDNFEVEFEPNPCGQGKTPRHVTLLFTHALSVRGKDYEICL